MFCSKLSILGGTKSTNYKAEIPNFSNICQNSNLGTAEFITVPGTPHILKLAISGHVKFLKQTRVLAIIEKVLVYLRNLPGSEISSRRFQGLLQILLFPCH